MVSKKTKKMKKGRGAKAANIDVRKTEDAIAFKNMLDNNKAAFVLVYADYCGHCHTYKDNVWNKLIANPNRKNAMASIHYDQLEKTPLASTKVSGYPTILYLENGRGPMKFKNKTTGEEEIEIPDARDLKKMESILSSEPQKVVAAMNGENSEGAEELVNMEETLNLDEKSKKLRENNSYEPNKVINSVEMDNNLITTPKKPAKVPKYTEDMLNSQAPQNNSIEFANSSEEVPKRGGSLLNDLLEFTKLGNKTAKKRRSHARRKTQRR